MTNTLNPQACWQGTQPTDDLINAAQRIRGRYPNDNDVQGVALALAVELWPRWRHEREHNEQDG